MFMRKSGSDNLFSLDTELERTLRRIRKKKKKLSSWRVDPWKIFKDSRIRKILSLEVREVHIQVPSHGTIIEAIKRLCFTTRWHPIEL